MKEGDLLVKIKPDIYQSILDQTKASLNTAKASLAKAKAQRAESKAKYNRNQKLFKDEAISQSEFEQIEVSYKVAELNVESAEYAVISAEASVKEAEENLDKTAIYAPVSGTIIVKRVCSPPALRLAAPDSKTPIIHCVLPHALRYQ